VGGKGGARKGWREKVTGRFEPNRKGWQRAKKGGGNKWKGVFPKRWRGARSPVPGKKKGPTCLSNVSAMRRAKGVKRGMKNGSFAGKKSNNISCGGGRKMR